MLGKDFIKKSTKYSIVTTNTNHLQPGKIASPFVTTLMLTQCTCAHWVSWVWVDSKCISSSFYSNPLRTHEEAYLLGKYSLWVHPKYTKPSAECNLRSQDSVCVTDNDSPPALVFVKLLFQLHCLSIELRDLLLRIKVF